MAYDKDEVWKKGTSVDGFNNKRWRKDACGAWMDYNEYGNTDSKYGWQVDYIFSANVWGIMAYLRKIEIILSI